MKDRDVNDNSEYFHDFAAELSRRGNDEEINEMHYPPKRRHDCNPFSEPLDLSMPRFSESTDPEFKIFYPEILVFVSNEIIESMYSNNNLFIIAWVFLLILWTW